MRGRIIRLTVALAAGFAIMLAQLTNLGFVSADGLRSHELNTRAAAAAIGNPRGAIISADGEVLALPIDHDDTGQRRLREYPHGPLYAHVVGYLGAAAGASGIERSYDSELSGAATGIAVQELADLFADSSRVGDVVLTLHHGVQLTARAALGDRDGAVVVIDTATGALIAMWSRPSFDPEALVSPAPGAVQAGARLPVARAYQRHYAIAADESLGRAGVELLTGARREPGPTGVDLPGEPDGTELDGTDIGSGDEAPVRLTPLQLAAAAAAVANDGIRLRPHVVGRVDGRSTDGELATPDASVETRPRDAGRLFDAASTPGLLARMAAAAQQASIRLEPADGVQVTAAVANGPLADPSEAGTHTGSWAVLLTPADAPTVAVAVLIEPDSTLDIGNGPRSDTLATMIAATAAEATLALRAVPDSDRP
ncbi:penicillin-binding transpeptidase domain-containing protein [Candidatus Poriferisodalis sp.]|uniref:penicillin-binding transpeptidase domain-containing protein n=1 Tax=Candidatus Poriferisodalis sp. TaxID=3101277 RepID=UPI003B02EC91